MKSISYFVILVTFAMGANQGLANQNAGTKDTITKPQYRGTFFLANTCTELRSIHEDEVDDQDDVMKENMHSSPRQTSIDIRGLELALDEVNNKCHHHHSHHSHPHDPGCPQSSYRKMIQRAHNTCAVLKESAHWRAIFAKVEKAKAKVEVPNAMNSEITETENHDSDRPRTASLIEVIDGFALIKHVRTCRSGPTQFMELDCAYKP